MRTFNAPPCARSWLAGLAKMGAVVCSIPAVDFSRRRSRADNRPVPWHSAGASQRLNAPQPPARSIKHVVRLSNRHPCARVYGQLPRERHEQTIIAQVARRGVRRLSRRLLVAKVAEAVPTPVAGRFGGGVRRDSAHDSGALHAAPVKAVSSCSTAATACAGTTRASTTRHRIQRKPRILWSRGF